MSSDWLPDAEQLAASIARIYAAQGSAKEVALLAVAEASLEESSYDSWNGGTYGYTLFLRIPTHSFAQLTAEIEKLERAILAIGRQFFKPLSNSLLNAVVIAPAVLVSEDWREKALAWAAGKGVSNQGRVRSDNIAARQCDGLLFRSQEEINLYKALKASGVTFAPLPVFLRGGPEYRRIEPDFVLVKDGVVLHVEVDGDTVHLETPAEAHARTTMLLHEGVPTERVLASECRDAESAARCAQKLLGIMAKHKASR